MGEARHGLDLAELAELLPSIVLRLGHRIEHRGARLVALADRRLLAQRVEE